MENSSADRGTHPAPEESGSGSPRSESTLPAAPAPAPSDAGARDLEPPAHRTRPSGAWTGVVAGAVLLLLLLIFILENTQRVKVSYLGVDGHLSLGVALLLAAVAGA